MTAVHEIRDVLCDVPSACLLADSLLDRYSAGLEDAGFASLTASLASQYHDAIEYIGATSESPIERMLFTSFLVECASNDPFGIMVKKVGDQALQWIEQHRQAHAAVRMIQGKAKAKDSPGTVSEYIDWLVVQQHIREEEAEYWRAMDIGAAMYGDAFHLIPQAVLHGLGPNGKAIRVDALVYVPNRPKLLVAIECDGYEWHSNRESFDKDRRRDRRLKTIGCEVLRYSGSEIHRDPPAASYDLYEKLTELTKRAPKPRRWKYDG